MGQQTESIGVALEMRDVVPKSLTHFVAQEIAAVLGEERLYGLFARMAKRRVAHVMGQTGRLHDGTNLLKQRAAKLRMAVGQTTRHIVAEALAQ